MKRPNCVHDTPIQAVCKRCDIYTPEDAHPRWKDQLRFSYYVGFYVRRLEMIDLYVTQDGRTLWSTSLDKWRDVR